MATTEGRECLLPMTNIGFMCELISVGQNLESLRELIYLNSWEVGGVRPLKSIEELGMLLRSCIILLQIKKLISLVTSKKWSRIV